MAAKPVKALLERVKALAGLSPSDRRRTVRERVWADVRVRREDLPDSAFEERRIDNVSATGALLVPRLHAQRGERLCIRLHSPDMDLRATVATDTERGTGVAFESDQMGPVVAAWLRGTVPAAILERMAQAPDDTGAADNAQAIGDDRADDGTGLR